LNTPYSFARDGEHLRAAALERGRVVADLAELTLAGAGERERIEDDHHRLPAQLRQRDVVAVLILQREVGCDVAD
jgi:hypothetical protein